MPLNSYLSGMKKIALTLLALICSILLFAQKQMTEDSYLLQKLANETKENLTTNILPFWSERMFDTSGGFYGRMDGNDQLDIDAQRGGILNARILWTFSSAYRILGDSAWLSMATHARNYIIQHFIDRRHGGTFRSVDAAGNPVDKLKQTYSQAFFIYALTEYYRVTGDEESLGEAKKIFALIEHYCYDKQNNGYFEAFDQEWKRVNDQLIGEKSEQDTKGMNTHLHLMEAYTNLYRVWPDKMVAARLRNLIRLFLERLIDPQTRHLVVFTNDQWEKTSDINSYGHDIEASWLLDEAATVLGDTELKNKVEEISLHVLQAACEGLQPDGSLIYEKDIVTGHSDTDRHWWPQAEAIVGFTNAWKLTGDKGYLLKAKRCWEYTNRTLVDHQHGEWYYSVSEQGVPNRQSDKAGFWKCPYHNGRMCLELIERVAQLSAH